MPYPMTRLCVRVGRKEFNSHSLYSLPCVVNNITRTEAIQLDLRCRRCIRLIPLNSLRISFRKRVASNLIGAILIIDTIIDGGCRNNCALSHQRDRRETRARIVKEASRLLRERGFENVGVGEVMTAAGLTHGAFYAHFGSKEELKAAAVADGLKVWLTAEQNRTARSCSECRLP